MFIRYCAILLLLLARDVHTVGLAQSGQSDRSVVFRDAKAIARDPEGFLYVVDAATSGVVKVTSGGTILASAGGYGWSDAAMDRPADVCAPNGMDVYVADYGNHRIIRLDRNLNFISSLSLTDADGRRLFGYPRSVACSGDGVLYIVDGENQRIVSVTSGNQPDRIFGDVSSGEGRLTAPMKIRVGPQNTVYVLDGSRTVIFDAYGNFLRAVPLDAGSAPVSLFVWNKTFGICDRCRTILTVGSGRIPVALPGSTDTCAIRDCTAGVDTLYLLTRQAITAVPYHTEAAPDSSR